MSTVYIGIDLAAKECTAAVMDQGGKLVSVCEFPTSEKHLASFMQDYEGRAVVLLEECDLAFWAARVILPYAQKVEVADPVRNAWIHKDPVKNDRIDARKLAEIARAGRYHPVYHTPDERIYALHMAVKAYDQLSGDAVAAKNRIKAKLRAQGVIGEGSRVYGARGRQEALARVGNPEVRGIIAADYERLDFLLAERAKAKGRFLALAAGIPVVRAWQAIPGVGPYVAAVFCAYITCPQRFSDKRKLWRYCRLGITQCVSGGKELRRQRLDRRGCGQLKHASMTAFLGAMHAGGDNRFKRAYAHTLAGTGSEVHARLTVQRKILAVMWAMWLHGTPYDDTNKPHKWA
ncbi:MAG: IS110 family transposase [Actinobacteria bacterium]|jgi:transposase|nr:MAG: IS110 family transposase [Actinomycetota bacterium]